MCYNNLAVCRLGRCLSRELFCTCNRYWWNFAYHRIIPEGPAFRFRSLVTAPVIIDVGKRQITGELTASPHYHVRRAYSEKRQEEYSEHSESKTRVRELN